MSADPQVEAVLAAVTAIDDSRERAAYLDQACAGDAGLRREVESLLAAHDEAGTFLQQPASGAPLGVPPSGGAAPEPPEGGNPNPLAEKEGDRIGRYKLLEKIGTGGFGDVWMAEQEEPVRRRVALKIIKLGMDTKEVIARFEAERQALALMDHPNIAKVHDGGATETGRPYFVMELVRGIRITDYCDANNLPTVERLNLFMQVCQAVQHAHQKGIIHRDIKPSNILVTINDGVPVPKVIDFGIAKATEQRLTDKTVFTRFMELLGTPAYMSPEQAGLTSLDIDTRSDIYSLGVLLYELLTGKTPFDTKELLAAGLDEMRRTIREKEPVRPSTRLSTLQAADQTEVARRRKAVPPKLINLLRGDLDWIVMKALEKDRTRRYETANAIALDIRRHLADEPVSATAPSAVYRFGKFARRNKAALGVAGAIAAILVIATFASTWEAIRATRAEAMVTKRVIEVAAERDQKDKARQAAETARQAAEAARQEAEAISTFLTEVFQSPDPARAGRTITVAETLDRATRKLDTDFASQSERRVKLQTTLGVTYHALGLSREAIPLLEKARDYYLASLGRQNPYTLFAMNLLGNSYDDAGRREEALKLREDVLALCRKLLGPEHHNTLIAMNNLALSYHDAGRRVEALKLREEVLPLCRKVLGSEHPDTLSVMHNLATSYHDAHRRGEALKLLEEVLALRRKLLGLEHPDTLKAMVSLSFSYHDAGRWDEALKLREEVLPLCLKVLGPEHPDSLSAMDILAISYGGANRRIEALRLREEVLALRRKVLGPENPDTLAAMHDLALSYHDAGRRDEALKLREEVLALYRKVLGPEHPDTIKSMNNLAVSYLDAGRSDEALKLLEEVLLLCRKVIGPEHPDTLMAMHNLARSYADAGRQGEALKLREEVLALRRKVNGLEHPDTLSAMNNLAISYDDVGRRDKALKLREEVLALYRKVLGPEHADTLSAMLNLAISYHDAGRRDAALKLREEVLALRRKVIGPEHPDTLKAMNDLALSYHDAGRRDEALHLREEVLALRRKLLGPEHPDSLKAMDNLALSYADAGRRDEALKLREQLLTLRRKVNGPEHPDTLDSLRKLAETYKVERKYAEAEPLYRENLQSQAARFPGTNETVVSATSALAGLLHDWAWSERGAADKAEAAQRAREAERLLRGCLAIRAKTLRPASSRLAETRSRLGDALVAIAVLDSTLTADARQVKLTKAETLLLEGHEALWRNATADPEYKRGALERLVRLYEACDRPDQLAEWKKKLAAFEKAGLNK
jgi:tetratricopeptide (TPR) repeat protein